MLHEYASNVTMRSDFARRKNSIITNDAIFFRWNFYKKQQQRIRFILCRKGLTAQQITFEAEFAEKRDFFGIPFEKFVLFFSEKKN